MPDYKAVAYLIGFSNIWQWITTAGGMIHCELPHGEGEVYGLHLWVNLAKKYKLMETAYQGHPKDNHGVTVKVIAGEAFGIKVLFKNI